MGRDWPNLTLKFSDKWIDANHRCRFTVEELEKGVPVFTSCALAPPFPLLAAIEELTVLFVVSNDNPIVTAIKMSGIGLDIPIIFKTIRQPYRI